MKRFAAPVAALLCASFALPVDSQWSRTTQSGVIGCEHESGAFFPSGYAKSTTTSICKALNRFLPWLGTAEAQTLIGSGGVVSSPGPPASTWTATNLGDSDVCQFDEVSSTSLAVRGRGTADGVGGTTDAVNGCFAHKAVDSGNVQIILRFNEFDAGFHREAYTFFGVMVANAASGTASFGAAQWPYSSDGTPEAWSKWRLTDSGTVAVQPYADGALPECLAVTYDILAGLLKTWTSGDASCTTGSAWTLRETQSVSITAPYNVGLLCTSHDVATTAQCEADQIDISSTITLTGGGPPPATTDVDGNKLMPYWIAGSASFANGEAARLAAYQALTGIIVQVPWYLAAGNQNFRDGIEDIVTQTKPSRDSGWAGSGNYREVLYYRLHDRTPEYNETTAGLEEQHRAVANDGGSACVDWIGVFDKDNPITPPTSSDDVAKINPNGWPATPRGYITSDAETTETTCANAGGLTLSQWYSQETIDFMETLDPDGTRVSGMFLDNMTTEILGLSTTWDVKGDGSSCNNSIQSCKDAVMAGNARLVTAMRAQLEASSVLTNVQTPAPIMCNTFVSDNGTLKTNVAQYYGGGVCTGVLMEYADLRGGLSTDVSTNGQCDDRYGRGMEYMFRDMRRHGDLAPDPQDGRGARNGWVGSWFSNHSVGTWESRIRRWGWGSARMDPRFYLSPIVYNNSPLRIEPEWIVPLGQPLTDLDDNVYGNTNYATYTPIPGTDNSHFAKYEDALVVLNGDRDALGGVVGTCSFSAGTFETITLPNPNASPWASEGKVWKAIAWTDSDADGQPENGEVAVTGSSVTSTGLQGMDARVFLRVDP